MNVTSIYKGSVLNFRKKGDKVTLGTWWWTLSGINRPVDGVSVDQALAMLIQNNVTEIYLDVDSMMPWQEEQLQGGLTSDDAKNGMVSELKVRGFVKKCSKYGIRVAALTGASGTSTLDWIDPARNYYCVRSFAEKIAAYQADAAEDERFYAIHLDVEPHTISDYGMNRDKYNQWFADHVAHSGKLCRQYGLQLEYDIWGWYEPSDMVKDSAGEKVNLLQVLTKQCNALCIMAYYNVGATQFERAADTELAYAKKNNCRLVVAAEVSKIEPANTTYYYNSKSEFIQQQSILRSKLDSCGYGNVGAAVHHIGSWYAFMTKP